MSNENNQPTGKDFGASCLILLIVVGGIAAGFGFFFVSIFGGSEENVQEPTKQTAYSMACHWVGEELKAPDSADFPFTQDEKHTAQVSENTFRIESYVDAQNSFGTEMRTNFVAKVKYEGDDQWRLISLNFD